MIGCSHIGISDSNSIFISRYTQYMWGDIPDQFTDMKNPLYFSAENMAAGKVLYQTNCLACHGALGGGDGLAGVQLRPRPADLKFTRGLPLATDAFFFWTVSQGGKSFNTGMPAFAERLSDNEIWQLIHYINNDTELAG